MAANLLDQVKALATPEAVERISGALGEDPQATGTALTGAAVPAVLGGLVQHFASGAGPARLMGLIKQQDPDGRLLDQLGGAAGGQDVGALQSAGQGLVSSLFGARAEGVADVVAAHSGVKKPSAMSILSIAAATTLGFLGQKVARGGLDAGGLGSLLQGARGDLARAAPPGLASAMGVPSFAEQPAATYAAAAPASAGDTVYREPAARAQGAAPGAQRWLVWFVAAVVALGAVIAIRTLRMAPAPRPTATAPTAPGAAASTVQMRLPDGTRLNVAPNSLAFGLANYLANPSAPAPPQRFTFETLQFPTAGSALPPQAQLPLSQAAAILNAYPNAIVRVESYTDNIGAGPANLALSQSRAEAVRNGLISRGVDAGRVSAQGLGDSNPVASNDTEAGRAQNRRTELVVVGR